MASPIVCDAERTSSILENGDDGEYHLDSLAPVSVTHARMVRPKWTISDILDVFLDHVGVGAAVHEHFFNAGICKEFESILDQWGVGERKETLLCASFSIFVDIFGS